MYWHAQLLISISPLFFMNCNGSQYGARIGFKMLILIYKAIHGLAPAYLSDLVAPYITTHSFHSSDSFTPQQPTFEVLGWSCPLCFSSTAVEQTSFGGKKFSNIRLFKKSLKTHFWVYYHYFCFVLSICFYIFVFKLLCVALWACEKRNIIKSIIIIINSHWHMKWRTKRRYWVDGTYHD